VVGRRGDGLHPFYTKELYTDIAWACRDEIWKAKACREMETDACDWE